MAKHYWRVHNQVKVKVAERDDLYPIIEGDRAVPQTTGGVRLLERQATSE